MGVRYSSLDTHDHILLTTQISLLFLLPLLTPEVDSIDNMSIVSFIIPPKLVFVIPVISPLIYGPLFPRKCGYPMTRYRTVVLDFYFSLAIVLG